MATTFVLMAGFSWLVARTRLGRDMRACEQDLKMASLLGVDIDRTISLTFVIGAALASVAGIMYLLYYGVIDFYIASSRASKRSPRRSWAALARCPARCWAAC